MYYILLKHFSSEHTINTLLCKEVQQEVLVYY
jgi:hypothetical protein